ncbi:WD40 repeat-like protein [Glarea lozoyensis ATCC 20868]|uniref:WD40 repeat-like protein n=1 Tax=Glarea lozoyensis (strain ATCC 20868 / MF5171) TaxID=1116229 RepID=S3DAU8_GLAL2|nr:WD40 repeat-like protein [Glarea lozoyensis ATCC 20868]EPE35597.1 WD40 repeat-like protein [Glarea lozoyensis ATCC 20868]
MASSDCLEVSSLDAPRTPPPQRTLRSAKRSSMSPPPLPSQLPPTPTRRPRKEKSNPSVTPRRFRTFFTPRSMGTRTNGSRRALFDITAPALNSGVVQSSPIRPLVLEDLQENQPSAFPRDLKRRKLAHSPESLPKHKRAGRRGSRGTEADKDTTPVLQSSPCARACTDRLVLEDCEEEVEEEAEKEVAQPKTIKGIDRLVDRGLAGSLLQMNLGSSSRGSRLRMEYPVNDWRDETANFSSNSTDVYMCGSLNGPGLCIPFCTASLNTNSLTAIGDEQGGVRLLETKQDELPAFSEPYVSFKVHNNAIIDMTFTNDDSLLATASGDSTARVVDMLTQTTIAVLGNHCASLKQVRFQSGANNNHVLATSSRDGSVQIWDLRCKGLDGPVNHLQLPVEPHRTTNRSSAKSLLYGRPINSIYDVHRVPYNVTPSSTDTPSRNEVTSARAGSISVTALQFLPAGLDHLLLTASEMDAEVKLWDIRTISSTRKKHIPLSHTKKPESHNQWRHFGTNSLCLNTSGSRLYTLCKDNTVYAYSTAHLILGHTPELSLPTSSRRSPHRTTQGLGPLHAYRHPKLQATSFYCKAALRKSVNGDTELLAVGSNDGSAVLFPTDERYIPTSSTSQPTPSLRRSSSSQTLAASAGIPVSSNGTALIRGHDREVGSLSWTTEGDLITVGDDYLVRAWHQGSGARELRMGGEGGGKRWRCGWADVEGWYDDDEF